MTMMASAARDSEPEGLRLAILWGAWSELGLSGWSRSHRSWAIDPEPLILATPAAAHSDPRLRDEALDWCIRNWRHVSKVRLRNMLGVEADDVVTAYAGFAAIVNAHANTAWPGAAAESGVYAPTRRSSAPRLVRASMIWLRLRAVFGISARAEILRYFLSEPQTRASINDLSEFGSYNKRNVADAAAALEQAGLLARHAVANRLYYTLERADQLRALLGAQPPVTPDWSALLHVTAGLAQMLERETTLPTLALPVEAQRTLRGLNRELAVLGLRPPTIQDDFWPAARAFACSTLTDWAHGRYGGGRGAES